jgi:hypothetical protein
VLILIVGGIGASQSWNRYTYVGNSPMNYVDPLGLARLVADRNGAYHFEDEITVTAPFILSWPDYQVAQWTIDTTTDFENRRFSGEGSAFTGSVLAAMSNELHRPVDPVDDILEPIGNISAGFGDTLTFGLTDWIRGFTPGSSMVDRTSGYYTAGQLGGEGWFLAVGGGGISAARSAGWRISAGYYPKAKGVGINLKRHGKRVFGLDWHKFKLNGKMVNRPHYHRSFEGHGGSIKRHRPWQGW